MRKFGLRFVGASVLTFGLALGSQSGVAFAQVNNDGAGRNQAAATDHNNRDARSDWGWVGLLGLAGLLGLMRKNDGRRNDVGTHSVGTTHNVGRP